MSSVTRKKSLNILDVIQRVRFCQGVKDLNGEALFWLQAFEESVCPSTEVMVKDSSSQQQGLSAAEND